MNKIKHKQIDEVNMLFENIKTILITWLSHANVVRLLTKYTHYEIRNGKYVNGNFIISDLVVHDGVFKKLQPKRL